MKKKINRFIEISTLPAVLGTLVLLSIEAFIRPGVVRKYLPFDISLIATYVTILSYYYYVYLPSGNLSKYFAKLTTVLTIVFAFSAICLTFLERINYPNYVFSHFHADPRALQLLALFVFLQYVFYKVYREHKTKFIAKYQNWIIISFSVLFSIFLLGNNLQARWSIIDDHEIVNMLGSDQKMFLWEIPGQIFQTEVAHWGESVRYRPSYYSLRVLEGFLWGGNPQLWYAVRIGILVLFLFVLVKIITKEISLLGGLAFAIFVMIPGYWSDVLTRLGPAEIYSVLGLSIYAYSFYEILKINSIKKSPILSWLGIFIGGIIMAGSKENFVIFAVPSLFLIIQYLIKKQLSLKLIFPLIHIIYSIFIALGIILAVKATGQDIYMNEITLSNRWILLTTGFTKTASEFKIMSILNVALILYLWQVRRIHIKEFITKNINAVYLLLFLFVVYVFQIIYYSGAWPTSSRYDFPGILAQQLFWLTWVFLLLRFVITVDVKLVSKIYLGLVVSVSTILIFSSFNIGFGSILTSVDRNVASTRAFTSRLDRLQQITSEHSNFPVILRSRNLWDYEAVYSLVRYAGFLNIKNQLYLDYKDEDLVTRNGLEKRLSEDLDGVSRTGLSGNKVFFEPFLKANTNLGCIDVNISYSASNSGCLDIDKINLN